MILLVPLFVMLSGGAISVAYMCWQGVKVQQAANLAARIEGQERVSGGRVTTDIDVINGTNNGTGDDELDDKTLKNQLRNNPNAIRGDQHPPSPNSVYGKFYKAAKDMFTPSEQNNLLIPQATPGLVGNTDQVNITRVIQPLKILNLQINPITLHASAYGGEDPHMYGLPRWGCTGDNATCDSSHLFWNDTSKILKKGND